MSQVNQSSGLARLVLLVNPSEIANTFLEHTYLLKLYISGEPCGPFEPRAMVQTPFYFFTILSIDLSIITMHVPLLTIICMFDCKLRCTLPLTAEK